MTLRIVIVRSFARAFMACGVLAGLGASLVVAAEQPAEPGSGFLDPQAIPEPMPRPDIEPVYRAPTIDTLATIRKRGTLRVGVAIIAPMVMHDPKGELIGFSIDAARKLAEDMGTQIELVETSWSQIVPGLLRRDYDVIITGFWITPSRALVVNYSDPTTTEGIYLIASTAQARGMKTREDFNRPDVRIAAYEGTIQERLTQKFFPKATLVTVKGDELELDAVLEGKAHAVLVPTFAPRILTQSAPGKLFVPLKEPLESTATAMAVRKGDPDILNYLNSWLTVHRDDDWFQERVDYWSNPANWQQ